MTTQLSARDECPRCGASMTVAAERVTGALDNGHHATLFRCRACGREVRR
jgi:transcription elongation factor Elf1